MSQKDFPTRTKVVIVGGGVMGCGLAYHLAHEGWGPETVLLEKAELTSGSTWHAAGQITHSTSSFGLGKMVDYNIGLYSGKLEEETGQAVTWHGCGSFRLAYSEDEMDWLRHTLSVGRSLGFNIELVGPEFVATKHPFYNLDGVIGALYTPDDGHVDPSNVTMAMATGARQKGVRIFRRCQATNITQSDTGEWVVETPQGTITCEHVVNAGGTYARQMGEWSGLQLPMTSMTHHYLVTENVPEFEDLETELPVIRDDKKVSGYIRMEQKKGLIGIYEKQNPNTVWEDHCPWEAENELFAADYDRIMPWLENSMDRMPIFAELGITREVHGAISHPPDGNPMVGPAPGVKNYWCACGTQIGIGWGPGLTRELAKWMVHGSADISMRDYDPRRFGDYAVKEWQVIKAKEDYCLRHEIPFPHFNRLQGRPIKPSPMYKRLKEKGAVYEEVFGHERPRWFAKNGVAQHDHYSFRRNEVHDIVGLECKAVREAVGIMDISAFTKVKVSGADAEKFLDGLVANRLPKKVGGIALTHLLNRRGRIELETTVVKLADDAYYLVCAAFFENRLLDHLNDNLAGESVVVKKLSDDWAALTLNGPKSREVLAQCTDAPLDNTNFRWLTAQQIKVAGHDVWAFRMSYAGELGWEFHIPRENALAVYDALWAAGEAHGIADYGSFAMNAMRMEKAFKGAGELTNEVTLSEADVMRFAKLDKEYLGVEKTRTSAEEAANGAMKWVCAYLQIEPDGVEDGHGGEAVLLGGKVVGSTASVAYGHTYGKILAFAYIKPYANVSGTEVEVIVAGKPRKGKILAEAVYDPASVFPRTDAAIAVA
ncbi:FAD-dependent oxidoreductase [Pseudohalocynthiibacter aestuariivivens]|jgi:dimethylglycine dehydrogenase|uniref:FAD-dependent oxidoreductase n=1 Tax=Pseudohalocynthiibacter aestuariivivens TaxID=1591409 RepID=A0ABV5JK40_9RHOB|nr:MULTISPECIES: FAD-dependent oxidoreductase [Pseudohalocynthiibacter]MBS9717705.1 FAD-dependent oxidoreductase [Pseudohalocynthiibacter aestuariivivens]MCK0102905.1 FAD-dependent oxidoreductase [Pseudohalocynthiibacter sp. F2068]